MEFPTEAVYGPNHDPASLSNWDGRDEYEDVVQIASRDDDGNSYDGDSAAVEVTRSLSMGMLSHTTSVSRSYSMALSPRSQSQAGGTMGGALSPRSQGDLQTNGTVGSGLWTLSADSDGENSEPTSPHIDTSQMEKDLQQPQSVGNGGVLSPSSGVNSPSSANSLMMDLSDLEHSVTNEVSTVKDWMRKVKAERDRLRRDKTLLSQQLVAERQTRDTEVSKLRAEVNEIREKSEGVVEHLKEELKKTETQVKEEKAIQETVRTEVEAVKKQLSESKMEIISLEGALVKEKSSSTLREATKLEEARKEHFAQLSKTIADMEEKFELDLKEMTASKGTSLDEERVAHAKTVGALQSANNEKERISQELESKSLELEKLMAEHEKCAILLEDSVGSTKEELASYREDLAKLQEEHKGVKEELEAATTEKQELASQLEEKSTQLTDLQKKLHDAQAAHLQEQEHIKEETKKMCELNEVTSTDRDQAREDLKEAQSSIEDLNRANDKAYVEIAQLKVEAKKRQMEIDTLNDARRRFETYEEESKAEIKRLQLRLKDATSDILMSCQSNSDSSSNEEVNNEDEDNCDRQGGSISNVDLTLPNLDEQTNASSTVIDSEKADDLQALRDELEVMENERRDLHDEIDRSKEECERLRRIVEESESRKDTELNGVVQQLAGNDAAIINRMEKKISDLKTKLTKAEEAFVKAEVEKCEKIAGITGERDDMASQIKSLTAELAGIKGSTARIAAEVGERVRQLQDQLDSQVQENERLATELANVDGNTCAAIADEERVEELHNQIDKLSSKLRHLQALNGESPLVYSFEDKFDELERENRELSSELLALKTSTASAAVEQIQEKLDVQVQSNEKLASELETLKSTTVSTAEANELQETLESHLRENEKLSSELISLRAAKTSSDVESVAIEMGKEMETLKQEHRIEVKLMKKEHASIKTKAKLLAKEKDELADAYEQERLSNNELESSLEEMVNLLQAERDLYGNKAKDYKLIKKKFNSMKKKRVPVDCAFKATRILLERLEQRASNDSQDEVKKAIRLIDGLTQVLDEQGVGSESSLASISETFSSENNKQMEELSSKCECLEIKCRAMKMKIASYSAENSDLKQKIDQLKEAPSIGSLKDMRQTSLLSSSMSHDEDLESLREANKSLKEKTKSLTKELVESTHAFEETITSYETVISKVKNALSEKKAENEDLKKNLDMAQRALDETETSALKKQTENVEELKLQLAQGDATVRSLEADKKKLRSEVDRLKADFTEVITQFEKELTLSCEASEAALQQKHEECEAAEAALREKQAECTRLEKELKALENDLSKCDGAGCKFSALVSDHESNIQDLRLVLDEKEVEKRKLELLIDRLKISNTEEGRKYQAEIEQLKSQLNGAMSSVDTNTEHELIIHELQRKLSDKESQVQEMHESIDQMQNKLGEKESEVQEFKECIDRNEEEAEKYLAQIEQLQSKLERAMLSLDDNMQFYEQLRAECASLKEEKETVIEKNGVLSSEISSLADTLEQLHQESTKLREEKVKLNDTNGELTDRISSLTRSQEQLRADGGKIMEEKEVEVRKNDELAAKIISLTSENESIRTQLTAQIVSLTSEKERYQREADSIESQLESIREGVNVAEEGRQKARLEAEETEEKWKKAAEEAKEAHEKLGAATSKLNEMGIQSEKQEEQLASLHEELKAATVASQKASITSDAMEEELLKSREELLKVTTKLDEMLLYTEKLKAGHEETVGSMKRELDEMKGYTDRLKAGQEETVTSLKNEMNKQMESMNEVVQSLQSQIKSVESDKEENRRMYEKDISLQQAEVETMKVKHSDALKNLDSLTDLVSNLKAALESEKENAQILLSQFKKSEQDRKSHVIKVEDLEKELAAIIESENIGRERIRNLEGVEKELASRMKSESIAKNELGKLRPQIISLTSKNEAQEEELNKLRAIMMDSENAHNDEVAELKSKIDEEKRQCASIQERTKSLQQEFKHTIHKKEEDASKLRVVLQEAKDKLGRMYNENEELKNGNAESMHSMQQMLNDAIRSRANTDSSLQESLQLLEQQKRIDIKRKGEIAKLEQTVEILKSKERYLESYVASLKKQIRRG